MNRKAKVSRELSGITRYYLLSNGLAIRETRMTLTSSQTRQLPVFMWKISKFSDLNAADLLSEIKSAKC